MWIPSWMGEPRTVRQRNGGRWQHHILYSHKKRSHETLRDVTKTMTAKRNGERKFVKPETERNVLRKLVSFSRKHSMVNDFKKYFPTVLVVFHFLQHLVMEVDFRVSPQNTVWSRCFPDATKGFFSCSYCLLDSDHYSPELISLLTNAPKICLEKLGGRNMEGKTYISSRATMQRFLNILRSSCPMKTISP